MYRISSLFFLLLLSVAIVPGCTVEKAELPKPIVPDCDTTVQITYANYVSTMLANTCTFSGCHAAGSSSGDYTTYAGVKLKADNGTFRNRVLVKKDMPSSLTSGPKSLSSCELKKLDIWLKNGAPQ